MNTPRFERYPVTDRYGERKWKWRARAANGEIVATCGRENYATKQKAGDAITLMRTIFVDAPIVDQPGTKTANRGPRRPPKRT